MTIPSRAVVLVLQLGVLASWRLFGQCPDGSSPPCRAPVTLARIPIDSNTLAVLPFRTTGPANDIAWLSEGMVDLLSVSLDGFAGWRTVHPRTVLARTGTMPSANDVTASGRAARSAGAATMVLGSAVAVGPELRLHADLYDAVGLRRLAAVDAIGTLGRPGPVVDSVAVGLARGRLRQRPVAGHRPSNEYATTSPQSLRAYLSAEQLARRGLLQAAADSLLRAIALDSTFGLAYYRLWVVTTFGANPPRWTPRSIIREGLRHSATLPQRQRDLLAALDAQYRGLITEALRQADELRRRYPDDAEAAYVEGEAYYHLGLFAGEPRARAVAAFERGIRLDPDLPDNYNHAIELRTADGDTVAAWALLRQLLERSPSYVVGRALEVALRVGLREVEPVSALSQPGTLDTVAVLRRAQLEAVRAFDAAPGLAISVADTVAAVLASPEFPRSERAEALARRAGYRLALGRYHAADSLFANVVELDATSIGTLHALVLRSLFTGSHVAEGRSAAAEMVRVDSAVGQSRTVSAAWRAVMDGDTATALALLRERLATQLPEAVGAIFSGLRGLTALARGDTAPARAGLRLGLSIAPYDLLTLTSGGPLRASPHGRFAIALARLERAAGDPAAALQVLHFTSFATGLVVERAEAEELRGQIAEQRGDAAAAVRAYRNFIALWKDADPELQPRVAAARAALARLTH